MIQTIWDITLRFKPCNFGFMVYKVYYVLDTEFLTYKWKLIKNKLWTYSYITGFRCLRLSNPKQIFDNIE